MKFVRLRTVTFFSCLSVAAWWLPVALGGCAENLDSAPRYGAAGGKDGKGGMSAKAGTANNAGSGNDAGQATGESGQAGVAAGGAEPSTAGQAGCSGASCADDCLQDPLKTSAGTCGCGTPDTDTDTDGVPDCKDDCPMDPERTVPGVCGCDVTLEEEPLCKAVKAALKHRYTFDGEGTEVKDSAGTANGTLVGNTLKGNGVLKLEGADQYVNLPNGIISTLTSATFEVWITWAGANIWERIFDFGDDSTGVEDARSTGGGYLFLSPRGDGGAFMRAVYRKKGQNEIKLDVTPALQPDKLTQLAIVFDDVNAVMTLYLDGNPLGAVPVPNKLSELHDVNNWLGRSQFKDDKSLVGTLHDYRIYAGALTALQMDFSFNAGPDAKFLAK